MDDIYNRVKVTITGESNDDSMSLQDLDTFCPQLSYKQVCSLGKRRRH